MKKSIVFLLTLFFIGLQMVFAQTKTIKGTVTGEDGEIIPGVAVMVKETTIGSVTNIDGQFTIQAPDDASMLVFSFVGMQTKAVAITGEVVDVVMQPDTENIDEVVVTALGISRAKKSLGYAVQKVSGDDVNQVQSDNFVTSLSGRVAGVKISQSTNLGGSSNVVIRGSSSITGNNQALFVIDGVPIDNSINNSEAQSKGQAGYDYGNAASDINPNDIESVNVLKGAAATALYGSRAANGVVLITTKKGNGSSKGVGVSISSNVTVSKIDKSTFPTYQKEYGAGYGPYYGPDGKQPFDLSDNDLNGDGELNDLLVPFYEDASRGARFDPSLLVYQYDAFDPASPNYMKATPWVAGANDPTEFFETGVSFSNNISVSGGDEKTTYRLSYTNFDQNGILPNSSLKKNNLSFVGSHKILDNLTVSSSMNYVNTKGKGRASTGYSSNIMSMFRQWYQVNVDIKQQEELYKSTRRNVTWNRASEGNGVPLYWDNPYWARYENYQNDERDRLIGYAKLDWQIAPGLTAMGRYAIDTYNELQEERKAVGSIAGAFGVDRANAADVSSGYSRKNHRFIETNMDFMLSYSKTITADLNLNAMVGTNFRRARVDEVFASTNGGLSVPGIYSLSNSLDAMLPPEELYYKIGENGYFGSASLGYKDFLFFDGTYRVDQSSTLPSKNRTYPYYSVTGSVIFSELLKSETISFGKFRLNYAEVGNGAPALVEKDTYKGNASFAGQSLASVRRTKNNPDLKPERTKSVEAGLEMKFLKNRAGFDLAVYKTNSFDQLMPVKTSFAVGIRDFWTNAGEIENKGIETTLYLTPIKQRDFQWDITANWSKNVNEVVELYTDSKGNKMKNLQLAGFTGGVSVNAYVGERYGAIQGSNFVYHEASGRPIVDKDGYYKITGTNNHTLGYNTPDWIGGIQNQFRYKNLSLGFLIDISKGGEIFSCDMWYGSSMGLYEESAGLNDLGNPKRDPIVGEKGIYEANSGGTINPGVLEDGSENTIRIDNNKYTADGYASSPNAKYVYDASYVKLRELTLSYTLPKSLLQTTFIKGATLSFVGSNLWIIHKNLPYADPEASQGAGNLQGWQSGVLPASKNYGFSVKLNF